MRFLHQYVQLNFFNLFFFKREDLEETQQIIYKQKHMKKL